ncbi:hypothetical protein RSAG8_03016, partial [Rhizoctonia solani AG-8 WAC10335]
MDEMDDANVPHCVCALQLLSQARISLHKLLDDVLMGDLKARGLKPVVKARSNLYKSVEGLQLELTQQAKSTQVANVESEVVNKDLPKELTFDAILKEVQENTPMLFDMLT